MAPESVDMPKKYVFSAFPLRFLARGKKYSRSKLEPPSAYPNPTNKAYMRPGRMILVTEDAMAAIAVTLPNLPVSRAMTSMRNQPNVR